MTVRTSDPIQQKIAMLDPLDFEEMCAELLTELGFVNVRRQASGTQFGYDIAAELVAEEIESWFFECKRYARTIPLKEISNKLLWADTVDSLDYFVVMSNAQLSNDFRQLVQMPSHRSYRILTWTGPVFRRLLTACHSTASTWFRSVPRKRGLSPTSFLEEQRGHSQTQSPRSTVEAEGTVTVSIKRSKRTPGNDPCYAVIMDYAGNEIARITLRSGRTIHLQLPKEAMGKPVRIWYDFHPNACMARHYPNEENLLLLPELALPSENLKDRISAVCNIPLERWGTYIHF